LCLRHGHKDCEEVRRIGMLCALQHANVI
jgi:hypothetical protein